MEKEPIVEKIIKQMENHETSFSKYATKSNEAIRLRREEKDIRLDFSRDADRILHTLTYTRYIDKTQVYSNVTNDHISIGTTNATIMNNIIMDIIKNSFNKPYIEMSKEVFNAVVDLKKFNMENIYKKSVTEEQLKLYKKMFNNLYDIYLDALKNRDYKNDIYLFLNSMCEEYKSNTKIEQIVIDFISGMTDRYMELQYNKYIKNNI